MSATTRLYVYGCGFGLMGGAIWSLALAPWMIFVVGAAAAAFAWFAP